MALMMAAEDQHEPEDRAARPQRHHRGGSRMEDPAKPHRHAERADDHSGKLGPVPHSLRLDGRRQLVTAKSRREGRGRMAVSFDLP